MRKVFVLSLALAGGCAAQGVSVGALAGSWALSKDGATARYTFEPDALFTFEGKSAAGDARLHGAWFADSSTLTISVDGGGTFDAPYTLDGEQLSIVDDPATARAGSHATATYTRQ